MPEYYFVNTNEERNQTATHEQIEISQSSYEGLSERSPRIVTYGVINPYLSKGTKKGVWRIEQSNSDNVKEYTLWMSLRTMHALVPFQTGAVLAVIVEEPRVRYECSPPFKDASNM